MSGTFILRCPYCGQIWEFEGYELSLAPFPRATCPDCGNWIPAF